MLQVNMTTKPQLKYTVEDRTSLDYKVRIETMQADAFMIDFQVFRFYLHLTQNNN